MGFDLSPQAVAAYTTECHARWGGPVVPKSTRPVPALLSQDRSRVSLTAFSRGSMSHVRLLPSLFRHALNQSTLSSAYSACTSIAVTLQQRQIKTTVKTVLHANTVRSEVQKIAVL